MGGPWSVDEKGGQSHTLPFADKVGAYDRVLGDLAKRSKEPIDAINGKSIRAKLMMPIDSPEFPARIDFDFEKREIKVTRIPEKANRDIILRKQRAMESAARFYQAIIEAGDMRFGTPE